MKKKIRVLVICGGSSSEREVSLNTGAQIVSTLSKRKYLISKAEIQKDGRWLLGSGSTKPASRSLAPISATQNPEKAMRYDVAFIAMHGKFGEDGTIQAILETIGVPHTGSGVLASALGMDKEKADAMVREHGIRTPKCLTANGASRGTLSRLKREIKKGIGYPCVVKPNASGSSVGVTIAREPKDLGQAIKKAIREDRTALIQQFIDGRELTCGVLGNSGSKLRALPPVEIIPPEGTFVDYEAKYHSQATQEICPAPIPKKLTKELQESAKAVHSALGCDGLTRSDFILSKKKLYFLEINTIPGLTEASLCPKEAKAAGISFEKFLDKQIDLALSRFGKK